MDGFVLESCTVSVCGRWFELLDMQCRREGVEKAGHLGEIARVG